MTIHVERYLRQAQQDYCEITLVNNHNMQVKLLNYGATLEQVLVATDTGLENVIMSLNSPADYSKVRNFLGGTVGRIAGRVRHGQWQLGSQTLQLPLNDGINHIHGGMGTDTQIFDFATSYNDQQSRVDFTLLDPDGHNGYPGNLKLQVSYTLNNDNQLTYQIKAMADKLTIFNPTNHVYFRLDGSKHSIKDLTLQINSDDYLPLNDKSLPYKGRQPVEGTVFDFRTPKRVGDVLNSNDPEILSERGLNHPFLLRGNAPAAILRSLATNRSVIMTTKAPSVVVYTANHFNHTGVAENIGQYDGIALEAQIPPAEGADLTAITLMPLESFETWTRWQFDY